MSHAAKPVQGRARFGIGLTLAALFVLALPAVAHLYTELRWFRTLALDSVFITILWAKVMLGIAVGLAVGLLILANLRLALRLSQGLPALFLHDPEGVPRMNLGSIAQRIVTPAGLGVGALAGLVNLHQWDICLQFFHASWFGVSDPIYSRDVGFYVFQLPFLETISALLLWTFATAAVSTAGVYWARGAITLGAGHAAIQRAARIHLSILAAALLSVLAFEGFLDLSRLLYSTTGPMTGASYADVNAKLPALKVKIATAGVAAVLVIASITREKLHLAIAGAVLYAAVELLGVRVYPGMIHRFSVIPNELEKETPYLKHNIDATRTAYGMDKVSERELSGKLSLNVKDIERNQSTIENIRLWDHQPLLDTFAQIQEIRTYYDFHSVDNDRYIIGGKLRQTMLSPRELTSSSLPNRTWINERFTFTHGYGLTLGPVNEATPEGLPRLLIQDMPPVSVEPSLKVTRPAIYYGELSNDHVFVRTRNKEFHHPSGEGNVYSDYKGRGGVRFDSALTRLAVAIRLGSLKLLLSDDIDSNSRVLIYRRIQERVRRIAPFLRYDYDPYMVVREDGTLIWICDAYTVSNRYPYSEPIRGGFNYIRNSVKVVIDAYHGSVTFYIADDKDPLLRTWRRIFPKMFVPLAKMPGDIRAHLRYPEDIFKVQTEMFAVYHMNHPQLLYNREDQWEVPTISAGESREQMEPYYTVMTLPGEKRPEFILMLPFTPKRKDNLAAWMVARADAGMAGPLVVYRFPKDRLVFGPQQIVNRINQDADISRQISLWDQRGSEALFGTLLVIPIEESLIYVRPLYLRSEGGKIPELKRVIVVYENRIAMEKSLAEAVDKIFGVSETAPTPKDTEAQAATPEKPAAPGEPAARTEDGEPPPPLSNDPRVRALTHFRRAVEAQRAGDWAAYGRELQHVERYLQQMQPEDGN